MKISSHRSNSFPRQAALLVLASSLGLPVWAQQSQPASDDSQQAPAAYSDQQPSAPIVAPAKEGFWGRMNPWARKKWVKKQTDPINDRLSELDEVNAKNARDIKDVD